MIDAHPLESHDPDRLRYGAALLHTIEPVQQQGTQQQAALAFVQTQGGGER